MTHLEPVTFKKAFRASEEAGLALFARAPAMHLVSVDDAGGPVLRTVHGVVVNGAIAFHSGDHGGKLSLLDRRAVLSVEEVIAEIPSTFVDPVMACPATTYFRSAMAHGTLRRVDDRGRKAEILQALMERFQPQGGHAPITASDARYTREIERVLIVELAPERITTKHKLGQNKRGDVIARILEQLHVRGASGDLRAIRTVREAHPERPLPDFLRGPGGVVLCVAPDARDADQVARLLQGQYWTHGMTFDALRDAHFGSAAWVVARAGEGGDVVASARAVSDGVRLAFVMDVIVHPSLRGRGVGTALMRLLLSHPQLRHVMRVGLRTRDAHAFYAALGFTRATSAVSEEMVKTCAVAGRARV